MPEQPRVNLLYFEWLALVAVGLLVTLGGRLPIRLGHLPGDIEHRSQKSVVYFPCVSCLIVSAIVSAVLRLFNPRLPHPPPDCNDWFCSR
jgi:hypothetical protein